MKNDWHMKKIGDVCSLMTGGTPSKLNPEYFGGEIRWLVSGDINQREIFECRGRITETGMRNSNAKLLPINSVMIALNGQGKTRGTVALLRTQATCNQSLVCIYPNEPEKLLPEFLFANLHGRYQELRQMTGDSGNDRRGLNMRLIENIEFPLPPVHEQQRIVAILDEAFEAIAKAKENAEKNLQNARELFETYLERVFANPGSGWNTCKIEDHISFIDYRGRTPKKTTSGLRLITAKNVKNGFIQRSPEEYVDPKTYKSWMTRGIPQKGDILFTSEAPLANVAQLDTDEKVVFAQRIIILQPKREIIDETFLKYMLLSNPIKKRILTKGTGATVQGIKARWLKQIQIYFPNSLPEQRSVVSKLDALSSETKKLEAIYQKKLADLEELKKSILQKAFEGELAN